MKRIIFVTIACVLSITANARENKAETQKTDTTATFNKTIHDFGTVSESGGVLECDFSLTNTSDKPLVITKVSTSCGCTAPDWSKEPIGSGKQGFVKISFKPKGRAGNFTKSLTVFTNGNPSAIQLSIKGNVERESTAQK